MIQEVVSYFMLASSVVVGHEPWRCCDILWDTGESYFVIGRLQSALDYHLRFGVKAADMWHLVFLHWRAHLVVQCLILWQQFDVAAWQRRKSCPLNSHLQVWTNGRLLGWCKWLDVLLLGLRVNLVLWNTLSILVSIYRAIFLHLFFWWILLGNFLVL